MMKAVLETRCRPSVAGLDCQVGKQGIKMVLKEKMLQGNQY